MQITGSDIHSFTKCLLKACYASPTASGLGVTEIPALKNIYYPLGARVKQAIAIMYV